MQRHEVRFAGKQTLFARRRLVQLDRDVVSDLAVVVADRADVPRRLVSRAVFAVVDRLAGERLAVLQSFGESLEQDPIGARALQQSWCLAKLFFPGVAGAGAEGAVGKHDARSMAASKFM
jgi:hypothetical protein